MQAYRSAVAGVGALLAVSAWVLAGAGQQLPLEPLRESGQGVTPAYEGWFPNQDGTFTLLVGYFNRNRTQTLEIPIGPNNRVEPGGPDQGQPTFFAPRRQWGVFSITVPKDFGTKKLTWTIVANGETASIPLSLHPGYQIEPYKDPAMGNTPPVIKFEAAGATFTGPPKGIAHTLATTMPNPVTLNFWVSDQSGQGEAEGGGGRGGPRPPASVTLNKHRGPGDVQFSANRPELDFKNGGRGSATASFSAPGEYILRVQVNDSTGEGGGGFQCCWTNAHVRVTVNAGK